MSDVTKQANNPARAQTLMSTQLGQSLHRYVSTISTNVHCGVNTSSVSMVGLYELCPFHETYERWPGWVDVLGPNFWNFPKTFSKDLPMSDDLGISKKFSYPNFQRLSLHFQRTSSFLIFLN